MRILTVRNVHEALPRALQLLLEHGVQRDSRNGPVLQAPWPVSTVYEQPCERVLFWPRRDANPFFHLYESLWMLAGRRDVAGPVRYAQNMKNYSDDGVNYHGAYGFRWRKHFYRRNRDIDQLTAIAHILNENPEDRRCILQMWDPVEDLGQEGKDFPCNTTATFQRDAEGKLHLVVFCRSNDIIWGAYGANAVHFSMLLEYMASWIGCSVGTYTQVSVNWHAYLKTLDPLTDFGTAWEHPNPYTYLHRVPLFHGGPGHEELNARIKEVLACADMETWNHATYGDDEPFFNVARAVLQAHQAWRTHPAPDGYLRALDILSKEDPNNDWIRAASEWMERRLMKHRGNPV